MELHAVSAENQKLGFSSSTYSFNLPAKKGDVQVNRDLAQAFVDKLCAHEGFKPCVSFG
jgi:hypothetical protein